MLNIKYFCTLAISGILFEALCDPCLAQSTNKKNVITHPSKESADTMQNAFEKLQNAIIDTNQIQHSVIYIFNYKITAQGRELYSTNRKAQGILYGEKDSCYFFKPIKLSNDKFSSSAKNLPFSASRCSFYDNLSITGCNYQCYLLFEKSKFFREANIFNNPGKGTVLCSFQDCFFDNGLSFNAKLPNYSSSGDNYITGCKFEKELNFGDDIIQGILDLSYCTFDTGSVNFEGINKIDTLDLSYCKFGSFLNLASIEPLHGQVCAIILTGSEINKLKFQYRNFKLSFPKYMYEEDKYGDIVSSTYEALLGNFSTNGYKESDSYEKLDVEYHDYKFRHIRFYGLPIIHYWNCYGYHKEWILYWSLFFLFILTCVTCLIFETLNGPVPGDGVYYISTIPSTPRSMWSRFWYSLMYTSQIFFQLTLKTETLNFKKRRVIYIFIVYIIGIVCVGYIANLVLQK
jgi:hypothetical protein